MDGGGQDGDGAAVWATDAELVDRVRQGDRAAFDDLYDRYADDVYSMCLLILGDATVARAAAGTAFALVARTRLNPLTDPERLRTWLLEVARGSALAWSGSPRARTVAVPYGVSPEHMLEGATIAPAPPSLRVGLSRTFDRAAAAAAAKGSGQAARAAARAAGPVLAPDDGAAAFAAASQPATARSKDTAAGALSADALSADAVSADAVSTAAGAAAAGSADGEPLDVAPGDEVTEVPTVVRPVAMAPLEPRPLVPSPSHPGDEETFRTHPALVPLVGIMAPVDGQDAGDGQDAFPRARRARAGVIPIDWRSRSTITVAASLALVVAGVAAAVNWPSAAPELNRGNQPAVSVIAQPAPTAPVSSAFTPVSLPPTVAGEFTHRPSPLSHALSVPSAQAVPPAGGGGVVAPPPSRQGPPVASAPGATAPTASVAPSAPATQPTQPTRTRPPTSSSPTSSGPTVGAPTIGTPTISTPTVGTPTVGGPTSATPPPGSGGAPTPAPTTAAPTGAGGQTTGQSGPTGSSSSPPSTELMRMPVVSGTV